MQNSCFQAPGSFCLKGLTLQLTQFWSSNVNSFSSGQNNCSTSTYHSKLILSYSPMNKSSLLLRRWTPKTSSQRVFSWPCPHSENRSWCRSPCPNSAVPTLYSSNQEIKLTVPMAYYRYVMLTQALLPAIHDVAGDVYAFQQDRTCLV